MPRRRNPGFLIVAVLGGATVLGSAAVLVSAPKTTTIEMAPAPARKAERPIAPGPAPVENVHPMVALQAEPAELTDENSAMLHVSTTPPGALVFIDYKGACYSPCSKRVSFGQHEVRLERGDRAVDRSVQVLEDTSLEVSIVESPAPGE